MKTKFIVRMCVCVGLWTMDVCIIWTEQMKKFKVITWNMNVVKCFLAPDAKNAFISNRRTTYDVAMGIEIL